MSVRSVSISLIVILLFAALPGSPAEAEAEACVIDFVPGLGPACKRPSGLFEVFDDEGRSLGTTHGPDPLPASGSRPISAAYSKAPACVEDTSEGYYARVIYAWASDRSPTKSDDTIRKLVNDANGILYLEAYYQDGYRDIRVDCEGGYPNLPKTVITRVELPTPLGSTTFSSVVSDLQNARNIGDMNDPKIHYWVYFEDKIPCGCSGTGHLWLDDRSSADNYNNGAAPSPSYAVTFGYLWPTTMLHELSHNMGAVQDSSPNSSGGGHCNDGLDIMCYDDGGDQADYDPGVCSSERYDCNHDDYFNIEPEPGSYLDSFWNIGSMTNRFLRGCGEASGTIALGAGPVEWETPPTYGEHYFGRSCSDRPFYLEGFGQDFYIRPVDEQGVDYDPQVDMDVCFYDGVTLLECFDSLSKIEQGRAPHGTNAARVYAKGGNAVSYSLRLG